MPASGAALSRSPSVRALIIRTFHPMGAACSSPVKRLLGGFEYGIVIEAVGFTPMNFSYENRGRARHGAAAREAGGQGAARIFDHILFADVPEGRTAYIIQLGISSLDCDGKMHNQSFLFAIHRPLEYVRTGESYLAETEPARPVSGCIAGDLHGTQVRYMESTSETRSRQVSFHWDVELQP